MILLINLFSACSHREENANVYHTNRNETILYRGEFGSNTETAIDSMLKLDSIVIVEKADTQCVNIENGYQVYKEELDVIDYTIDSRTFYSITLSAPNKHMPTYFTAFRIFVADSNGAGYYYKGAPD